MVLYLDQTAAARARFISEDNNKDRRRYYLVATASGDDAILVFRNGYSLETLARQTVDYHAGWEIAKAGFACAEQVGKRRVKVTIYQPATQNNPRHSTLTLVLEIREKKKRR